MIVPVKMSGCIGCKRRSICMVFSKVAFGFHSLPSNLFHGNVVEVTGEAWDKIFEEIAGCCEKFTKVQGVSRASSCLGCDNTELCLHWSNIKKHANGGVDRIVSYGKMDVFISELVTVVAKHCKQSRSKEMKLK